jgi:predicted transcriptional regulator
LDEFATATGRLPGELVATAIAKFLVEEKLALERIEEMLQRAIAGAFASNDERKRISGSYPSESL